MKRGAAGTTAEGRPETMEHLIPLEDDCMFSAVMRNRDACMGFLEALSSYINGGAGSIGVETGSLYVDRLDGYVRRLNMDEEWRMEHMKYELSLEQRFRDGDEKGRSEGFSEGEAVGISKGVADEKRRMVRELNSDGSSLRRLRNTQNCQ